jgi:hypothetical protein
MRQTVALAPLLTESITFALRGTRIRGSFRLADALWPVDADTGQMSQVFQNVALNAVQAMPAGGSVEVQADNVVLGAGGASLPLPKGRYISIIVQDHGCGIPREVLPKIFEPYFTTKAQGSGLGLADERYPCPGGVLWDRCQTVYRRETPGSLAARTPGRTWHAIAPREARPPRRPLVPGWSHAPPGAHAVTITTVYAKSRALCRSVSVGSLRQAHASRPPH